MKRSQIRIPDDLMEAAKAKAKEQHRSFNAYLLVLIETDILREGGQSERSSSGDRPLPAQPTKREETREP